MRLTDIKFLIDHKEYDAALDACNRVLSEGEIEEHEILRMRGSLYAKLKSYDLAINDFETIFEKNEATIGDYYLAAFWCLYEEKFEQAANWFEIVLKMGDDQSETWFSSATLFYLAYAQMELRGFDEAESRLREGIKLEEDLALPIPRVGMCTADQMFEEIKKRRSQGDKFKGSPPQLR